MNKNSKIYKVTKALTEGRTLTTAQIARLGVSRPRELIYVLRKGGMNIVATTVKTRTGHQASYQFVAPTAKKRRAAKGSAK